ncbi:MAG: hypothetical protein UV73_C0001G0149 [Candidatus Gottesmanbacteria bacterium GW2011_GWA2_43_14]|uniref:DUF2304 domain-containing protein n=1 Tax=Candidatus Gottesmanbacteria bacterium GW2011_GWA2_43_14 TaxID=1618443 RepID=A0A0G1GIQ4_9BACT|nr:MAG: hypothetical protein UV73_C0001G0149 [Candidatus Gottesmanbacteria bacterium GW2011_GWA2_43_14]
MSLTQILLIVFLLFALSRVTLQYKSGNLSLLSFLFWSFLFAAAVYLTAFPDQASRIAQLLGIGRGVDAVIYISIAVLFYLVFRLYVYLENVRQEITDLVRKLALDSNKKNGRKKSKN